MFTICLILPLEILYLKGLSVWRGVQRASTLRIRLFLLFERKPRDRFPQGGSQSINEDKEAISEEGGEISAQELENLLASLIQIHVQRRELNQCVEVNSFTTNTQNSQTKP